jgi:hypothetical protein
MSIQVYILSQNPDSPQVERLKDLFSASMFSLSIMVINEKDKLNPEESERKKIRHALKNCFDEYPESFSIIIKDSSVSIATPEIVEKIIRSTIERDGWDICYLCKWLDRCDLYTNTQRIEDTSLTIVSSQSPNGTQALLFSPHGRNILIGKAQMRDSTENGREFSFNEMSVSDALNKNILNGGLSATCIVPNLFDFDMTLASSMEDMKKALPCQINDNFFSPVPAVKAEEKKSESEDLHGEKKHDSKKEESHGKDRKDSHSPQDDYDHNHNNNNNNSLISQNAAIWLIIIFVLAILILVYIFNN